MHNESLPTHQAYDKARKELYRVRHQLEIERRVAREEALATGAFFGPGPNEIGMRLEDKQFEEWKKWALAETERMNQLRTSAYTGSEVSEEPELDAPSTEELEQVADSPSASGAV